MIDRSDRDDTDRVLRQAFDELKREIGKVPSDRKLADRAGVAQSTANQWKQRHGHAGK